MDNEYLKAARCYACSLDGGRTREEAAHFSVLVTAYATLAIAEKLYEERDAPVFVSQEQCNGIVEDFLRLRKSVVGDE